MPVNSARQNEQNPVLLGSHNADAQSLRWNTEFMGTFFGRMAKTFRQMIENDIHNPTAIYGDKTVNGRTAKPVRAMSPGIYKARPGTRKAREFMLRKGLGWFL